MFQKTFVTSVSSATGLDGHDHLVNEFLNAVEERKIISVTTHPILELEMIALVTVIVYRD